jgi:hypothetical protein
MVRWASPLYIAALFTEPFGDHLIRNPHWKLGSVVILRLIADEFYLKSMGILGKSRVNHTLR